ncbi:MAG: Ryanodine receptor Ryr [Bacteroidales bacterium]|nr:Ryanodine receptor Ryr [Bacteroidales bacterium]
MNPKEYTPAPIDTTDVVLPPELLALGEAIAKNVHEVWAQGRLDQGWIYGPERDDVLRHHPCLVAYEELSDDEKAFDRATALATLRLITKLGFTITPPTNH